MRTFPDLHIRDAVWESQRAARLLDDREWAAARDAFTALRARVASLGLESAYVLWGLAVALDAVTLLSPASRDAWLQKAALARTLGDEVLASSCDAQVAAIAASDVPFGVPSPRGLAC